MSKILELRLKIMHLNLTHRCLLSYMKAKMPNQEKAKLPALIQNHLQSKKFPIQSKKKKKFLSIEPQ